MVIVEVKVSFGCINRLSLRTINPEFQLKFMDGYAIVELSLIYQIISRQKKMQYAKTAVENMKKMDSEQLKYNKVNIFNNIFQLKFHDTILFFIK